MRPKGEFEAVRTYGRGIVLFPKKLERIKMIKKLSFLIENYMIRMEEEKVVGSGDLIEITVTAYKKSM